MYDVLRIADYLTFPLDAVTQSFAIIARKGRGKTYTAKVIAEEMLAVGTQCVVLDPIGVWWGLRSSADGCHPGAPIRILGGLHGDLPLTPTAGALIADLVVDEEVSLILDVSQFDSNAEQDRFARDFAVRLMRRKLKQRLATPIHLFIDEADSFAPQKPQRGQEAMLGAFESLVRRGRAAGIGTTLVTQRPAVLNKNVLTMTECLIVLQVTGPQDRSALGAWIEGNADKEEGKVVLASLASLEVGEAWVWSPSWLQTLQRIHVRQARTFDSSATPKAGERRAEPKVLADVDLERLKVAMEHVAEEAERTDPRRLQARIRDLERQLAAGVVERVVEVEKIVEVAVVPPWVDDVITAARRALDGTLEALAEGRANIAPRKPETRKVALLDNTVTPARPRPPARETGDDGVRLGKAERSILTVLAQHPDGRTKAQVAILSGYSIKSSALSNALGALRSAGYATKGTPIQATPEGVGALGTFELLPAGEDLYRYWMGRLGRAERAMLDVFVKAYPSTVTKAQLEQATAYSATSSGMSNALGKLRSLELLDGWQASDAFVEAIGATR